jgi:hypothetical protein
MRDTGNLIKPAEFSAGFFMVEKKIINKAAKIAALFAFIVYYTNYAICIILGGFCLASSFFGIMS